MSLKRQGLRGKCLHALCPRRRGHRLLPRRYEYICIRKFCHVLYAGVVAVQVNAVVQQHGNVCVCGLVTQDMVIPRLK